MLFPFDTIREEQSEMIKDVRDVISTGKRLIAHAPTGLGKTAAALSPALEIALEKGLTVYFLTSRQTQHTIAIETLQRLKEKSAKKFTVVDMVGKKNMCARSEIGGFYGKQFYEYCKSLRESDGCEYYTNFKKGGQLSPASKNVLNFLNSKPAHTQEVVQLAKKEIVCPFEISAFATKNASVIIADYNQIFNPTIRESFFSRNEKTLDKAIIIVDEAHNLPDRLRDMLTEKLSDFMIDRAKQEAEKWQDPSIAEFLTDLQRGMHELATEEEQLITRQDLLKSLSHYDIENAITQLDTTAGMIRESEHQSYIGSVADFLAKWMDVDEGFARIISKRQTGRGEDVAVTYQCLDPSLHAREVIELAHSVVIMSGTLTPLFMYKNLLGFPDDTVMKEYKNPFSKENRLALIVRGVTTKYSARSHDQYKKIAEICSRAANAIPGNVAIYFPSYYLMDQVHVHLHDLLEKQVYKEQQGMLKEDKQKLLHEFKLQWLRGGVLLAVVGGNFSEGVDLPNETLNGVIVAGLPLGKPDVSTRELINYYQKLYQRGWDFGYTFPAFTKVLQTAGRCIRTETDRGVIMFIDERYAWDNYYACFPKELSPKTTSFYIEEIETFFNGKRKTA